MLFRCVLWLCSFRCVVWNAQLRTHLLYTIVIYNCLLLIYTRAIRCISLKLAYLHCMSSIWLDTEQLPLQELCTSDRISMFHVLSAWSPLLHWFYQGDKTNPAALPLWLHWYLLIVEIYVSQPIWRSTAVSFWAQETPAGRTQCRSDHCHLYIP